MFGAYKSVVVADCMQAFADLQAELQWRGGGRVEFPDGQTFQYLSTQPATPTSTLFYNIMNLSNMKNLRWNMNGSEIICPINLLPNGKYVSGSSTIPQNIVIFGLNLVNCRNVVIGDLKFRQTFAGGGGAVNNTTAMDPYSGFHGLTIGEGCIGIEMLNPLIMTSGGAVGIEVNRSQGNTAAKRSRELLLKCETDYVFYGGFLEQNGDDSELHVKTTRSGRSGGAYGCSNWKLWLESQSGDGYDDCLVTCDSHPSDTPSDSATTNGEVWYKWRADPGNPNPKGTLFNIGFRHLVDSPGNRRNCIINNIKVHLDFDGSANAVSPGTCIIFDGAPAPDSGLNYMDDVVISGTIRGMTSTYTCRCGTDTDWTSVRRNVVFENITVDPTSGGSFDIDGRGYNTRITLRNIEAPSVVFNQSNMTAGQVNASQGVNFSNYRSRVSGQYQRHDFGGIRQRGTSSAVPVNGNVGISFPIAFSAAPKITGLSPINLDGGHTWAAVATTTTLTIYRSGGNVGVAFDWEVAGDTAA
jgi:hypothetical protein